MKFTVWICDDADRSHTCSRRAYAHVFCEKSLAEFGNDRVVCVASEFFSLPKGHRDGVLAHELGHLFAGPDGGEEDADRAFEATTGVRVRYKDGSHGRALQWLSPADRRSLLGVFEFEFEGQAAYAPGPESDGVRYFAKHDGQKVELDSLAEAEAFAVEDSEADVWAEEKRRRLGWRPLVRNPGDRPFTKICAWCNTHMSGPPLGEGQPKASHGICRGCLIGELAAEEKARADERESRRSLDDTAKNPDEELRRLERAARTGDNVALARLHAVEARTGRIDPTREWFLAIPAWSPREADRYVNVVTLPVPPTESDVLRALHWTSWGTHGLRVQFSEPDELFPEGRIFVRQPSGALAFYLTVAPEQGT